MHKKRPSKLFTPLVSHISMLPNVTSAEAGLSHHDDVADCNDAGSVTLTASGVGSTKESTNSGLIRTGSTWREYFSKKMTKAKETHRLFYKCLRSGHHRSKLKRCTCIPCSECSCKTPRTRAPQSNPQYHWHLPEAWRRRKWLTTKTAQEKE